MDAISSKLTDTEAYSVSNVFPLWKAGTSEEPIEYIKDSRYRYNNLFYKCTLTHTHAGESDWTPDLAHSLWVEISDPSVEWPDWKQPESTNPYMKGDKVTHKGKKWISNVDNNVWKPGAIGTEQLWTESV